MHVHVLVDLLLLEMEIEEIQLKIESMAEKKTTIERFQEVILKTQNTILCRLDIIERALHVHPRKHSTPYHIDSLGLLKWIHPGARAQSMV